MENIIEIEKELESVFGIIFPVTLVKYILNKKKILTIFSKIENETFKSSYLPFTLDNSCCDHCKEKSEVNVKCRMHTSIDRIFSTLQVVRDPETNIFLYKNEIFKQVNEDTAGIIYCPHTKLVPQTGEINTSRVKKITPFSFKITEKKIPNYSCIDLDIKEIENKRLKYWFSPEYYLILDIKTDPGFTLVPIK